LPKDVGFSTEPARRRAIPYSGLKTQILAEHRIFMSFLIDFSAKKLDFFPNIGDTYSGRNNKNYITTIA